MEVKQNFIYALNEDNIIVEASETEKDKNKKFYCPNCKGLMGLRKGEVNIHHFYHLESICNYETYLHKTAKTLLYDNIKKDNNFLLDKEYVSHRIENKEQHIYDYHITTLQDTKELFFGHNIPNNIGNILLYLLYGFTYSKCLVIIMIIVILMVFGMKIKRIC